jgi:hypothetical protein
MGGSTNPLVDPDSQFEVGDYGVGVDDPGSDYGGTSKNNPFTPGPGYSYAQSPHWLSGLPVLDSAHYYLEDVYNLLNGDPAAGFKAAVDQAAVAYEAASYGYAVSVADLGSAIAAPILAWAMDHVKPIKLLLDLFAGNPDMVKGVADTWTNIAGALDGAGADLRTSAAETERYWQGDAADAYRGQRAEDLTTVFGTLATLSKVHSLIMTTVGEMVFIVRSAIRDILSIVLGELIVIGAELLVSGGTAALGPAEVQATGAVARASAVVVRIVTKLLTKVADFMTSASRVFTVIKELITVINRIVTGK